MEEKHPQTIAAVGEYEFPEEIIHQIQSFMDEREAARTTLVSKSWYGAWSTRPDLSFDHYELGERLPEYARKTLQRYEDLNLYIQTFLVRTYEVDPDLAREWILKAIKLGAVDLTIDIEFSRTLWTFVLPDEVLESETLARLSVQNVRVDLGRRNKPLTSSNLKSLTLCNTLTKGDFSYLSRRFPLLEELTLEGYFTPFLPFYGCTTKLNKLEFLQLERLNTKDCFSKSELWLQFPCLKTLVIWNCHFKDNGEDVIRIRSPSLECLTISLQQFTKAKLEFDVPNIRKFMFRVYDVPPRLELKTSSREWEFDIRITCSANMGSASWLRSLKQLVKLLCPSRVSLALNMIEPRLGDQNGNVGDGLAIPAVENLTISGWEVSPAFLNAIPAVENLTISGWEVSPAFLNALFWSCRPNFVNIQRRCMRRIQKENVEQFQHLSSLPWNTLLDDSILRDDWEEEFVRCQLK